jgi:hypothetical protein
MIGVALVLLGGAIVASASGSLGADSGYSKFRAGKNTVIFGGVLLIVGVVALFLAITDIRLLNHFLYGP